MNFSPEYNPHYAIIIRIILAVGEAQILYTYYI